MNTFVKNSPIRELYMCGKKKHFVSDTLRAVVVMIIWWLDIQLAV